MVLLGCQTPLVLRPQPGGFFKLVGECYVHGMCDGSALLGHLPKPWVVMVQHGSHGIHSDYRFKNTETGELSTEDPRAGPLPKGWEKLDDVERTSDDPELFKRFRNTVTGKVMNSDPRLEPEALRARGVDLKEYILT